MARDRANGPVSVPVTVRNSTASKPKRDYDVLVTTSQGESRQKRLDQLQKEELLDIAAQINYDRKQQKEAAQHMEQQFMARDAAAMRLQAQCEALEHENDELKRQLAQAEAEQAHAAQASSFDAQVDERIAQAQQELQISGEVQGSEEGRLLDGLQMAQADARTLATSATTELQATVTQAFETYRRSLEQWEKEFNRSCYNGLASFVAQYYGFVSRLQEAVLRSAAQGVDDVWRTQLTDLANEAARHQKSLVRACAALGLNVFEPIPGEPYDENRFQPFEGEDPEEVRGLVVSRCMVPGIELCGDNGAEPMLIRPAYVDVKRG